MRIARRPYSLPNPSASFTVKEPWWKRWGQRILMTIGAFVVAGFLLGVITRCAMESGPALPSSFILTVQFTGALNEASDRISFFAAPEDDFYNVLKTLREGAHDPKVKALVARIWNGAYSLSQIQDIHDVLGEWRKAGKPTYAYSDSLGDGGTGMASYWLALGFDKIWVQPLGNVTVNGFRAEMPFAREALRKLGVTPEFFPFTTYKSAMDMFLRSSISDADRKQLQQVVDGLTDEFIGDIAARRKLTDAQIRTIIKGAPYLSEDAKRLKLIDQVGYDDELGARIRLALQSDAIPFVTIVDYMPHVLYKAPVRGKKEVALINLEGMIDDSMIMPEDVQQQAGAWSGGEALCVSCAIMAAADDPHISAVLLRINSPGGSPSASETIRRSILVARVKGKPVVVSMGDTAASGGYWIASAANVIVAQPTTLTGSIGVVGGKFATKDLFAKYGVNWDEVASETTSPNLGSFIQPFSPEAAAREKALLGKVYEGFKERVEEGRRIKGVEAIAQGRVWLGKDAKKIALVDELGGYETAKVITAHTIGLKKSADIQVIDYMPSPSPWQGLKAMLGLPSVVAELQTKWLQVSAMMRARGPQIKMDTLEVID